MLDTMAYHDIAKYVIRALRPPRTPHEKRSDFPVAYPAPPGNQCHLSGKSGQRSEEHTSELQSQSNLVCRLLLEKKKPQSSSRPPAATRSRIYIRSATSPT